MTITATIGGVTVPVLWPISVSLRINLRSTSSFVVPDATNTLTIAENMTVSVTDSILGTVYKGYVQSCNTSKLPGATMIFKTVNCKDYRYLTDKRYFLGPDYSTPRLSGDILNDFMTNTLAAEGVLSNYAQRYDHDASTWGAGTLSNTTGASGALQITTAGSTVTVTEGLTADFAAGTLTNVVATSNQLQLQSYNALQYVGTAAQGFSPSMYAYRSIWSGSYTIVSGDTLLYDMFISTTSPQITGGIDLGFSDGSHLRDKNYTDSFGINVHPATNNSLYASDTWYARSIPLTPTTNPLTGLIIKTCTIGFECTTNGDYTFYVKNVRVMNGVTLKATFFSSSLIQNIGVTNNGFYNTKLALVTAYAQTGSRISGNYSLTAAGIMRSNILSWIATTSASAATGTSSAAKLPQIALSTSIDGGATWQAATSGQPITALQVGQNCSGINLLVKETLALGSSDPTHTPAMNKVVATILPSYTASKSDVLHTDLSQANFGTGSLTNVTNTTTGLQLTGNFRDWSSGDVNNCTLWSPAGANATMNTTSGSLSMRMESNFSPPNANSWDTKSQFNFAGNWGDFIAELDILYLGDSGCQYGLCYRTTFWGTGNNTFAYLAYIDNGGFHMAKGSNNSSGVFTLLQTATLTLTAGQWYHLTVQTSGSTHTFWLDNIFMFSRVDATFASAGGFGARLYNNDTVNNTRHSGLYNNFGVQSAAFSGTRVTASQSLAAASVVGISLINWTATVPDTAGLLVESSINGGSTYSTCTNGAAIPGLSPGTNVASVSLLIRMTLTTQNANTTPVVTGLTTAVIGQYTSSAATRISPLLSLAPAGICGATSVTWNAVTPSGTTVAVSTSPDNVTYTPVGASGNAIPGIVTSPDPIIDNFLTNTSANYTQSSGTWTWDTANSRLVATVGAGKMVTTGTTSVDGAISTIMDYADGAGLVARWTNASNSYYTVLHDASSTSANTAFLFKVVAGVITQIGSSAIVFTRNTYHGVMLQCVGTTISVSFDGKQIISVTDASLSATGKYGFEVDTKGQFYVSWIAPQGQSLSGLNEYTKVTLTSTDARYTPSVTDLTLSVRSLDIDNGAIINSTNWAYQNTLSASIDDLAKRSNGWWAIRQSDKHLVFQVRNALLAPWPISSANSNDLLAYSTPTTTYNSPFYRNKQYVQGGLQILAMHEQRIADGVAQTWQLTYPVAANTVPVISVQNVSQLVGTGTTSFDFYYTVGSQTINQDTSEIPPMSGFIVDITYQGVAPVSVTSQSTAQQTLVASYDSSTGIIEAVETVSDLSQTAAQQLADARITQYALQTRQWTFTTRRTGLLPGQILYAFVPEVSLQDVQFLITDVKVEYTEEVGVVTPVFDISVSEGPPAQAWSNLMIVQT